MRTALVAALEKTPAGALRADLSLGGRSVLARQVDLLRELGCERILCLCHSTSGAVLEVQREVEAAGTTFQALRGFLHLPAMVRTEDELVILGDGVLPDPTEARALLASRPPHFVATLPDDSPLAASHPRDFERIDAERHWAGLLSMRGAPVQQLADFPPDSDAISLLLRLALQAGTRCREVAGAGDEGSDWLLIGDESELARHEGALLARAAGRPDWRRPSLAAARLAAHRLAPQGLEKGPALALGGTGLLLAGGVTASALGLAGAGLALAACGALAAALAGALARLRRRLAGLATGPGPAERLGPALDWVLASCLFVALSPGFANAPVGALGPLAIGLARLLDCTAPPAPLGILADRAVLLASLAVAAGLGGLAGATALAALAMLGGLLVRETSHLD